jgi:DNA-binding transcriptional regulator YiaG
VRGYRRERIREARLELGLPQKEFARQLGVTEHTVANWEAGRTAQIRLLNLRALSVLTGHPMSWFTEGE